MREHGSDSMHPSVPFAEALRFWCKLGFISFGGPAGQIAILHQELVLRRRWISERRFLHALNYCMLLPGPEAQQLATYMGWLLHRTAGGLAAGGLFVLPSLVILTALSWLYLEFGTLWWVAAFFLGIKPAVVAIVAFAAWRIGARVLHSAGLVTIAVLAFLAIFALDLPFPWIVAGAGVLGWVGSRVVPQRFVAPPQHAASVDDQAPALIDDDTPPPAHAAVRWQRIVAISAVAALLWAGALGTLAAVYGTNGTLSQMGWFFTKAALVTFGGAYAVLPYVFQGAVEHHAWLTPLQMIDGLALGETTPGPLIMVVAFVGFVGAWGDAASLLLSPPLAGIVGAVSVTFFTFLPSFFFIFIGAPIVEATRGHLGLASVLAGITAAAVGVIVNLALFFAYHVLWPAGFDESFSWSSAAIGVGAGIALFRLGVGVIPLVFASGLAGLALGLLAQFA